MGNPWGSSKWIPFVIRAHAGDIFLQANEGYLLLSPVRPLRFFVVLAMIANGLRFSDLRGKRKQVMLQLTPEEQNWLDEYRRLLEEKFPGLVEEIVIFGSKARGTATEDSDLDVLLIIREGGWKQKDAVVEPGYDLAVEAGVVPSIIVYTLGEWDRRRRTRAPFWQTVTRDGVEV